MTRPPKLYPLTLEDLKELCDAVCYLDGAKHYFIADAKDIPPLVNKCHDIIRRALGFDAPLVYGEDPEIEAENPQAAA